MVPHRHKKNRCHKDSGLPEQQQNYFLPFLQPPLEQKES